MVGNLREEKVYYCVTIERNSGRLAHLLLKNTVKNDAIYSFRDAS